MVDGSDVIDAREAEFADVSNKTTLGNDPMTIAELSDEGSHQTPRGSRSDADEDVYSSSFSSSSDVVRYTTPPTMTGKVNDMTVKPNDFRDSDRTENDCKTLYSAEDAEKNVEDIYSSHIKSFGIDTKALRQQFMIGGKCLTLVLDGQYSIISGLRQTWMRSEFDVGRNRGNIFNNEPYTVCFHGRRVWMRFCVYRKENNPDITVCAVLRSSCPVTNLMLIVKMADGSFERFEMHKEEAQWLYEYLPCPEIPLDVIALFKELAMFTKDTNMDFSRSRAMDSLLPPKTGPDNDTSGFIFIKDSNVSVKYEKIHDFGLDHILDVDGLLLRYCNVLMKEIGDQIFVLRVGDPFPCKFFIDEENMRCVFVGAFVIMHSLEAYNIKFYL